MMNVSLGIWGISDKDAFPTASYTMPFLSISGNSPLLRYLISLPITPNSLLGKGQNLSFPCMHSVSGSYSYALELIVDPNTFSRRENAPGRVQVQQKIGC